MKKIISMVLILALMISMFGCKSKPIEVDAEVYVENAGNEGENVTESETETPTEPEQDEEQPLEQQEIQQPEQDEKQQPSEPEVPEQDEEQPPMQQTEPVKENDTTSAEPEGSEQVDKAPPCQATIDDEFSDNEIGVVLTNAESRKQKEYTKEDFPELDIKEIRILMSYYPDTDGKTILSIVLQSHDKQKVLDGIRILEGYDIVYSAEPNYYGTILQTNNDSLSISPEQMENEIFESSVTPYYTRTDAGLEYDANLSTLACCAKKYTTPGINKTIKIGFVEDWYL